MARFDKDIGGASNQVRPQDPGPQGPTGLHAAVNVISAGLGAVTNARSSIDAGRRRQAAARASEEEMAVDQAELLGTEYMSQLSNTIRQQSGQVPEAAIEAGNRLNELQEGVRQGTVPRSQLRLQFESEIMTLMNEHPGAAAEIGNHLRSSGLDHHLFREAQVNQQLEEAELANQIAIQDEAYTWGLNNLPESTVSAFNGDRETITNIALAERRRQANFDRMVVEENANEVRNQRNIRNVSRENAILVIQPRVERALNMLQAAGSDPELQSEALGAVSASMQDLQRARGQIISQAVQAGADNETITSINSLIDGQMEMMRDFSGMDGSDAETMMTQINEVTGLLELNSLYEAMPVMRRLNAISDAGSSSDVFQGLVDMVVASEGLPLSQDLKNYVLQEGDPASQERGRGAWDRFQNGTLADSPELGQAHVADLGRRAQRITQQEGPVDQVSAAMYENKYSGAVDAFTANYGGAEAFTLKQADFSRALESLFDENNFNAAQRVGALYLQGNAISSFSGTMAQLMAGSQSDDAGAPIIRGEDFLVRWNGTTGTWVPAPTPMADRSLSDIAAENRFNPRQQHNAILNSRRDVRLRDNSQAMARSLNRALDRAEEFYGPVSDLPPSQIRGMVVRGDPTELEVQALQDQMTADRLADQSETANPEADNVPTELAIVMEQEGTRDTGYIPSENSGVTIGTGFDLGQWSRSQLEDDLEIPPSIVDKLDPFLGLRGRDAVREAGLDPEDLQLEEEERRIVDEAILGFSMEKAASTPIYESLSTTGRGSLIALRHWAGQLGAESSKMAPAGRNHVWEVVNDGNASEIELLAAFERTLREFPAGSTGHTVYGRLTRELRNELFGDRT